MESDIPSELDISEDATSCLGSSGKASELEDTLVVARHRLVSGECILSARILQVF